MMSYFPKRLFLLMTACIGIDGGLSGCASFPSMAIGAGSKRETQTTGASTSVLGRDEGDTSAKAAIFQIPKTTVLSPKPGGSRPLTSEEIAALVPDEPIGASLPPQPLPQFLHAVFSDILAVPYSLGPDIGARSDIITVGSTPNLSKRDFLRFLGETLQTYGLRMSAKNGSIFVEDDLTSPAASDSVVRSRSSADTPLGSRNVFQFFQLVALKAAAIQPFLQEVMSNARGVRITADQQANVLVVSGPGRNVATAIDMLRNLDQPAFAGAQAARFGPIFWNAPEYAAALNNALTAEGFISSTDPSGVKSILILPLPETNQVLAFASDPATMARIEFWAKALDQASVLGNQPQTFVYALQNTSASSLGGLLQGSLGNQQPAATQQNAQLTSTQNARRDTSSGASGGGLGLAGNAASGPSSGSPTSAGQANGAGASPLTAQGGTSPSLTAGTRGGQRRQATTITGDAGQITIDDVGNRILYTGTAPQFAQLRSLLQQLDTPSRQVLVEVTVAEVTLSDETTAGLEWFFSHSAANGGVLSGGTQSSTGASGLSLATAGLNLAFAKGTDLRASFNAFASNNKVNVLSRPRLVARSGAEAQIQVGSDVPIITSQTAAAATTTGGTTDVLQSVQYRQTGVILDLIPVIYGDNRVDIQVYQEVSSDQKNTDTNIQSPVFLDRTITTTLSLADGATAVMGGMMQNQYTKTNNGVPFAKDIPILGEAFRSDSITGAKTELVVLITPFIIRDSEDMLAMSDQLSGEMNRAFRQSRGGSYTLTAFAAGYNLGMDIPDAVLDAKSTAIRRREPSPNPAKGARPQPEPDTPATPSQ